MSTLPLTDLRGRRRLPIRKGHGVGPPDATLQIDVASLCRRLEETVSGEVRFARVRLHRPGRSRGLVADGFSCRTQIEQAGRAGARCTPRRSCELARERGPDAYTAGRPEEDYVGRRPPAPRMRAAR